MMAVTLFLWTLRVLTYFVSVSLSSIYALVMLHNLAAANPFRLDITLGSLHRKQSSGHPQGTDSIHDIYISS